MTAVKFARVALILGALGLAAFGIALLIAPALLGVVGIELPTPAARTEIRAFYGGLEIGLAIFLAAAARRDDWLRPALFAQAAVLGGIVIARLLGVLIDGSAEPMIFLFAAIEGAGAILGFVALRRLGPDVRG